MSWWKTLFVSKHTLLLEADLAYERTLNEKLRDDIDRLRLFLTPGLQRVDLHPDTTPASADPKMDPVVSGTPWQRVKARELAEDDARWREREARKKRDRESGKTEPQGAN